MSTYMWKVIFEDRDRPERRIVWYGGVSVEFQRLRALGGSRDYIGWVELDPSEYGLPQSRGNWHSQRPSIEEVFEFAINLFAEDW